MSGGTSVRIKGLQRFRHSKTGREYIYHRPTKTRIKAPEGTPEFFAELAALEQRLREHEENIAKPGTLGRLILDYRASIAFRDLAPRTKADYERCFAFLERIYNAPLINFTTPEICKLRDKWSGFRGRRFTNYVLTVLRLIFGRAVELGLMQANPVAAVAKVPRDPHASAMNRPWSEGERAAVLAAVTMPRWQHLRLPVAIAMECGMREGDVIRLPRSAIKGGLLSICTAKRRVDVAVPIGPLISEALALESHSAVTLCTNSKGRPWKGNGFRSAFIKMLRALEAEGKVARGCTFHGLRHDVATRLAEAGCSMEDIAAVLGQKSSRMAAHYAQKADRTRRTAAAITKLRGPASGGKKRT
jgi:integrase